MGVWMSGEDEQVEVAIKTVKTTSELERIKLLQEAAIMGQFAHLNVVRLLGVVTVGEPVCRNDECCMSARVGAWHGDVLVWVCPDIKAYSIHCIECMYSIQYS